MIKEQLVKDLNAFLQEDRLHSCRTRSIQIFSILVNRKNNKTTCSY